MPPPLQSYYPRCTIRLILRFDEFGVNGPLEKLVPKASTKNLNGIAPPRSPLTAQLDSTAPAGVTRYVLAVPGSVTTGGPQDQTSSSDGLTWDVTVIPKSMAWNQNGLKSASTMTAVIRYIDCPIDPRLVRCLAVEMVLGCITEDQMVAQASAPMIKDAVIIPQTFTGPNGETRSNVRFLGFANKFAAKWETGEPVISLECQDNTQLLHNQEMSPSLTLDSTKPLDLAVATFLSNYVQLAGISVEYRPSTDTPPVLSKVLSGTAFRPNFGPPMSKGSAGSQKASIWDYLTDICGAVGHAIRMDGTTIILQRVRSLLTNSSAARPDDPYQPRTVDGQTFTYRPFIYGRNIETLEVTRNYSKAVPKNIELRALCTERKTVLVARFPQLKDRIAYALPGNTQPDNSWSVKEVSGINDQATLNDLAQQYYEQQGRQELEIAIKTKNLGSFGGSNLDPDVLDMKVGDTFDLLVNRDPDNVNQMTNIELNLTGIGTSAAFMRALGFSDGFADAYATAYTNAAFLTQFKLKGLKVDWNCDTGVSLDLEGINYIEIRADKKLDPGQEPSNTALQQLPPPPLPPPGSQ